MLHDIMGLDRALPWPLQLTIVLATLASVAWFVGLGVQDRARAEAELSRKL